MKKSILFALGLLVSIGCMAEDKITVEPVTVQKGGTGVLNINLSNPDTQFAAFQFRLTTAEGISVAMDGSNYLVEKGERLATDAFENFNITTTAVSGTVYDLLAYQLQTAAFPGTNGTIVSITLSDDGSHDVGTTLQLTLSDIQVSDPESNSYDLNDVTFTVTIGEPDDGRIHFDEAATTLPTYTAGEKGNITMKRTIKTGQWSTLVLPFNLTKANATAIFGSDAEFAKFSGFVVDYGDDEENLTPLGITINFTSYTIPARGNMAGGTLVLVKPSTTKDISVIELDNVTLTNVITDTNVNDEYGTSGKFTGTLTKTKVPADGLFIADNQFWYSTGNTNIKAFRGWFELGAVLGRDTDFGVKMNFILDNNPTAIESIDGTFKNGAIYDLGGRKVVKPQRGVNIINGRKVAIH